MSDELPATTHLETLIDAYLEGEIDDVGLQQLSEELLSSAAARTVFWSMAQHVMLLEQWSGETWGAAAARADTAPSPTIASRLSRSFRGPLAALVALVIFSAATGASLARTIAPSGGAPVRHELPVGNGSFENPVIASPEKIGDRYVSRLPHDFGVWGGDVARIVEAPANIVPVDGHRVLEFTRGLVEPAYPTAYRPHACDIGQLVDLRGVVQGNSRHPVVLELSAHFLNAHKLDNGHNSDPARFMCRVVVFRGDVPPLRDAWPESFASAVSAGYEERDVPPVTEAPKWQRLAVKAVVPPSASFAIVQVSVAKPGARPNQSPDDFSGYFCDDVRSTLIGYDGAFDN